MELNIVMASDKAYPVGHVVETNLNGVVDLRNFMRSLIKKNNVEFMKDLVIAIPSLSHKVRQKPFSMFFYRQKFPSVDVPSHCHLMSM